jgi:predicted nucleic acid-binding protein
MERPPKWLEVIDTQEILPFAGLHKGESAAIALAQSIPVDLLLMDERKGVKVARDKGLNLTGTLGLLELARQQGLVDLAEAFERLRKTSFRSPEGLMDIILERNAQMAAVPLRK